MEKRKRRSLLLLCAWIAMILTNGTACIGRIRAADLMADIVPGPVQGKEADARFIENTAGFALDLFRHSLADDGNSLVSPTSVLLALAMTANGAAGATLAQMETVLGRDIPLAELNQYLFSYVQSLTSAKDSKLRIANSIWFRDDSSLQVAQDFLQTNADYYRASAYKAAFDLQTVRDINHWVEDNTDSIIEKIIDDIPADAVMYLINAMVFDSRWQKVYNKHDIYRDEFTAADGTRQQADFMRSEEGKYIDDGMATGFIKPYAGGKYSFVALLPNEGLSVRDYLAGLDGQRFVSAIRNASPTTVKAAMPKFSCEYTLEMTEILKTMGMPLAFSREEADFSRLAHAAQGSLYIGEVLHKAFIAVDELGTKAGAVTKVEIKVTSAPVETKTVILNRPFIFAIIDNGTSLPIFMGAVVKLSN